MPTASESNAPDPQTPANDADPASNVHPGVRIRNHLVAALQADLIGPFAPQPGARQATSPSNAPAAAEEILPQKPTRWYLTGFLTPETARERVQEADPTNEEELAAGDDKPSGDEAPAEPGPKIRHRWPSSLGLSALLPAATDSPAKWFTKQFAARATPHRLWRARATRRARRCAAELVSNCRATAARARPESAGLGRTAPAPSRRTRSPCRAGRTPGADELHGTGLECASRRSHARVIAAAKAAAPRPDSSRLRGYLPPPAPITAASRKYGWSLVVSRCVQAVRSLRTRSVRRSRSRQRCSSAAEGLRPFARKSARVPSSATALAFLLLELVAQALGALLAQGEPVRRGRFDGGRQAAAKSRFVDALLSVDQLAAEADQGGEAGGTIHSSPRISTRAPGA